MLTVTNKGQTEALTHFTGYELHEEVNGALELSLTSFSMVENAGHELLEEEAVITVDGRDFRIKQMKSTRNRKAVTAISTFYDLAGHQKYDIYGGTRTFNQFATWLFAGTGWTFESVDVSGSKLIPNYGNENFPKLLEVLLSTFECEREILPGKRIRFAKQIGPDNDEQYRYGHNIKALSHSVDTTNLRTSIKGFGGGGLEVTYTSPNASKFPNAGEAEPVRDDRFLIAASLLEEIKQKLTDTPLVAIEMDALELTVKALGERVWLIYEPLGVEFKTRILSKTTRIPAEKSSAVIGNAMPKTLTDALTETNVTIDENAKQSESKFEQTNERITMEVSQIGGEIDEAKASWIIEATSIRGEVTQLRTYTDDELGVVKEDASANFDILAGQITSAVSTNKDYTDTQTRLLGEVIGTNIQAIQDELSGVENNLGYAIDNLGTLSTELATLNTDVVSVQEEATANFDILSGSITSAVSTTRTYAETVATNAQGAAKTYTDGQINTVVSTASSNFNILSGRINAKAESSTVSALGTRVNSVELDMNAFEGTISQKVSKSDYNGNTIVSQINQSSTTVEIQASKIRLVGAVSVLSDLSGNLGNITAGVITGTNFTLSSSGLLDLRLGTILWGTNKPQADYAETAGNANMLNGQYTASSFSLNGHNHPITEYVKPYTGQALHLWRNGNTIRVYQGSAYTELTGIVG